MAIFGWRDWLFSAKAFAGSMLALYVALAAGLPRPYWAMATAYIVANPLSGATRSKALYRVLGTMLGAAASVVLVPTLVDAPVLLVANKLDTVHRRADIAPWLAEMQQAHAFAEFVPMSAKNPKDVERLFGICAQYLPVQDWWYDEDELTDRSEKFLASETVREKLFRLTGDELPYTSTVVIDKFEEEPPQKKGQKRLLRIAATIVVERDGHKAMVIGDKGERIKRIGTEARQELEKLMDAKVFIELWVKVRSGWADDEARVRSFGYE